MRLYHYLECKWALDDIKRRRLKLSKIDDMNDPYEWACVRSAHAPTQLALENTKTEIVEKHAVQCFSRSRNNILMWSHYADRHKGICLGFDVPDGMVRPVYYFRDIWEVGNLDEMSSKQKKRIIDRLYGAKYIGWKYEEEVRVHGNRDDRDEETGQYFVNFGDSLVLKEVIAGARFPTSRDTIDEALQGYPPGVKIMKAECSTARFEVVVKEWI